MVTKSTLDPIAEAEARIRLRYSRARSVRQTGKSIGLIAERIARKTCSDKGPAIGQLKLRWREIVGEDIAKYCRPEKLSGAKHARTLTLKVLPAAAPMIQHQSETIRARVSVAAGGEVSAIKIVQGALTKTPVKPRPRRKQLTVQERDALERGAANIADPKLRAAIVGLGEAMLSREG